MPDRVTPAELVAQRQLPIYDIRPEEERFGELGWIPGSLHVPSELVRSFKARNHASTPVVLACVSGRRSRELAIDLAAQGVEVVDLAGGLLAWAVEHPICTVPVVAPTVDALPLDAFVRQVRSCFVVEAVESGALEAEAVDPLAALQAVFDDIEPVTLRALWSRLDKLAFVAWQAGHRVDFIAEHVMHFYGLATRVPTGERAV